MNSYYSYDVDKHIAILRAKLWYALENQKEVKKSLDDIKHTYLCALAKAEILLTKINL